MVVKITLLSDRALVENQDNKRVTAFPVSKPLLSRMAGKKSASFAATVEHGSLHVGEMLRT